MIGDKTDSYNTNLYKLLTELSLDYKDGTPYYLRNYEILRNQTISNPMWSENHEAIVVGCNFGFVFGEMNYLPRSNKSNYISDIYFIYVHPQYRSQRKGSVLYGFYEKEITNKIKKKNYQQSLSANNCAGKCIEVRIPIRHCIKHCTLFWKSNGFQGDKEAVQGHLSKFIYLL